MSRSITKKNICAPYVKPSSSISISKKLKTKKKINLVESISENSCLDKDDLIKISRRWNQTYPTNKIIYNKKTSGRTLWKLINNKLKGVCDNEICWLKQDFMKSSNLVDELMDNFKPLMPKSWKKNDREWLNTLDILEVMNQYEVKYPDFEFMGPVPIDFDTKLGFGQCVANELCNINVKTLLKRGKKKVGVVFNLDKHNQPGSHWVALFCDMEKCEICYWDSFAVKPEKEIVDLIDKLKNQCLKHGKKMVVKINNIRHQYKNTECGMYCIYFLTSLLDGKTFESIIKNIIDDNKMNKKRKEFFSVV